LSRFLRLLKFFKNIFERFCIYVITAHNVTPIKRDVSLPVYHILLVTRDSFYGGAENAGLENGGPGTANCDVWLNGLVVSVLAIRTRGRATIPFSSNLGQVVYSHYLHSFSAPRN